MPHPQLPLALAYFSITGGWLRELFKRIQSRRESLLAWHAESILLWRSQRLPVALPPSLPDIIRQASLNLQVDSIPDSYSPVLSAPVVYACMSSGRAVQPHLPFPCSGTLPCLGGRERVWSHNLNRLRGWLPGDGASGVTVSTPASLTAGSYIQRLRRRCEKVGPCWGVWEGSSRPPVTS